MKVKIRSIEDANRLVELCQKYDCDIDVACGRYSVDGKSFIGVSSLIGNKVIITFHGDDDEEFLESVKNIFSFGC